MRLSLTHATTWQMRGAESVLLLSCCSCPHPIQLTVPPPTGSALLCYLAEVQGPLFLLLQLVMGRTKSPTLKATSPTNHKQ